MDAEDERSLLRKLRKRRGDDAHDLGEESEEEFLEQFEDPEHSDILVEKQVKEGKRKR